MEPRRHGVASPICKQLLDLLGPLLEGTETWALMGGTGLAEYYLGHRESDDVDLFTLERSAIEVLADQLEIDLSERMPGVRVLRQRVSPHCQRLHVTPAESAASKVELLEDSPPWFGRPTLVDGIPVGSLMDIAVGKFSAFITRDESRDLVDLWALDELGRLPAEAIYPSLFEKDGGLAAYPQAIADAWQRHAKRAHLAPSLVHANKPADLGDYCRAQEEAFLAFLRRMPGPNGPPT